MLLFMKRIIAFNNLKIYLYLELLTNLYIMVHFLFLNLILLKLLIILF